MLTSQQTTTGSVVPLGLEQEFLRVQHTGGFGDRNISSGAWRITGRVEEDVLRRALADVVARHEALRTVLVRGSEQWHQEVRPPAETPLLVRDLGSGDDRRDRRAEEFVNEVEAGTFLPGVPLLWAYLGRFDDGDAVLVLVSFLPQVDVWSIGVVMRDLMRCYAARVRGADPDLPQPRQYAEYVARQRERAAAPGAGARAHRYWQDRLRGAAPIMLTPDRGPAAEPAPTRCHRFELGGDRGARVLALARDLHGSPFSVLYAVYLLYLRRQTGARDGVVWTLGPGPGRRHRWTEDMVGYFVNMFALRTDWRSCVTVADLVRCVRDTSVGALTHEVPFIELAQHALGEMTPPPGDGLVRPAFQMAQNPARGGDTGDLRYAEVTRRQVSQPVGPEIPDDGFLWTMELGRDGGLAGDIRCSAHRFDTATLDAMVADYTALLDAVSGEPHTRLDRL
ncbi:condensation domain-containing protein [Micromonospora profundi]|uniref:condensation domain-containing protein n=1 Tax=Micromonospora profundi TaxID=1420889 RepID=UPI0038146A50